MFVSRSLCLHMSNNMNHYDHNNDNYWYINTGTLLILHFTAIRFIQLQINNFTHKQIYICSYVHLL